jgi:hypothetical protein
MTCITNIYNKWLCTRSLFWTSPHLFPSLLALLFYLSVLEFIFHKKVSVDSALYLESIILKSIIVWDIVFWHTWFLFCMGKMKWHYSITDLKSISGFTLYFAIEFLWVCLIINNILVILFRYFVILIIWYYAIQY